MTLTTPDSQVTHDAKSGEFYIDLRSGKRAYLRYHLLPGQAVDFYRTFVPEAARGQGLAAVLVDHALEWATHEGLEIKASCWYAENRIAGRDTV